jgi:hypothetical protein
MELLKVVGWVALGFIPTYGVLEVVSRKLRAVRRSRTVLWEKGVIRK